MPEDTSQQLHSTVCKILADIQANKYSTKHYSFVFKKFFPSIFQQIFDETKFLDIQQPSFRARIAAIVANIKSIPLCLTCRKELDISDLRPYSNIPKHCSCKCAGKDPNTDKIRKATKKNKYGSETYNNAQKISKTQKAFSKEKLNQKLLKTRKTKLERYGNEKYTNVEKSKEAKLKKYGNCNNTEKIKETCLKKFNSTSAFGSKEVREKSRLTKTERYGNENFVNPEKTKNTKLEKYGDATFTNREKAKQTCLKNHNVENPYASNEIKDKIKQTNLSCYGVEHFSQTNEYKEKVKQTCLDKYGFESYSQTVEYKDAIKRQNLEKYGVESVFQLDDIKRKIKETNLNKYGAASPMQNRDIRIKAQQRYSYNNLHFDSAPELAYYIWLKDANVSFEYQPNISFKYEFEGKTHVYMPDFKVDDCYVELKGDHFFKDKDPTKQMVCPYDHNQDALYEAKHQCMIQNDVKILTASEYEVYIDYVNSKYGKDYLKQFRKNNSNRSK